MFPVRAVAKKKVVVMMIRLAGRMRDEAQGAAQAGRPRFRGLRRLDGQQVCCRVQTLANEKRGECWIEYGVD